VQFQNIRFGYSTGKEILKGVTINLPAGSRSSLVGTSGSGKTTLSALLLGLYAPTGGQILLNGFDISRMDLVELRRHIGIVLEQNELFDGTLEENITMGRHFSYDEIVWALKTTQLYDDVMKINDGLHLKLLPQGQNISIGMRRRIMFARAIIDKPNVLILDEAFGGLEERTKLDIIQALYANKHWTIIDISHDAELIRRSEKVFVLSEGKIMEAESCSPRELATERSNTIFSQLFPDLVRQLCAERVALDLAEKSVSLNLPNNGNSSNA
jgi:ABC-type bacteriocin/lantibiotic exporter with double-glycine peptidase domain